jgi:small-conductance mechanosensitive channel
MARGWESKDVESQVEEKQLEQKKAAPSVPRGQRTPEQIRVDQERKDLQLSRTRIANDLEGASNPNHRKSLEAALAFLDKKLSDLD